ncbi:MAG: retropepsin-like aspartic protease family protein [Nitrososphaera sp.]|uniref:retropepsin-like aspartic protease family protein n=1 Tax=Nitrososphaera sp. TaxID=1971748 RepID=UPI003D6ECBDE
MNKFLLCCFMFGTALVAQAVEKISILGLFKDKAIINIDGKRRVLASGQTSPEGIKLIAADSRQAVLEIDGRQAPYALGTQISTDYAAIIPQATVQIWPDALGMYLTDGSINNFPVEFLVDTGATLVAMNKVQAKRLGLDYKLAGEQGLTTTASGTARAYYLSLDKVKVGAILLRGVPAAVIDGEFPIKVLLGNSFLNRLQMTRNGQVLELRQK